MSNWPLARVEYARAAMKKGVVRAGGSALGGGQVLLDLRCVNGAGHAVAVLEDQGGGAVDAVGFAKLNIACQRAHVTHGRRRGSRLVAQHPVLPGGGLVFGAP